MNNEKVYLLVNEGDYVSDGETLYISDNQCDIDYLTNTFFDHKVIDVENAQDHIRLNRQAEHIYKVPDLYYADCGYPNIIEMILSATKNQILYWKSIG